MVRKPAYLTPEGLKKLGEELEYLRSVKRPEVVNKIHRAKELGGTAHNPEYDEAKNEQAFVEGRIRNLESILKDAVIISHEAAVPDMVKLGCKVTLLTPEEKHEQFTIVGSAEADPKVGKISDESPVGKALLGCRVGEEVQVQVPAGLKKFIILSIE